MHYIQYVTVIFGCIRKLTIWKWMRIFRSEQATSN